MNTTVAGDDYYEDMIPTSATGTSDVCCNLHVRLKKTLSEAGDLI